MSEEAKWFGWNQRDDAVLPCPFCGSTAIGYQIIQPANEQAKSQGDLIYRQFCNECSAAGPAADCRTAAIESWNRRELATQEVLP